MQLLAVESTTACTSILIESVTCDAFVIMSPFPGRMARKTLKQGFSFIQVWFIKSQSSQGQRLGLKAKDWGHKTKDWDSRLRTGVTRPRTEVTRPITGVSRTKVTRPITGVSRPRTVVTRPRTGVTRSMTEVTRPRTRCIKDLILTLRTKVTD